MTKNQLFIELATPDENGFSRWVGVEEFVGKYSCLRFGNGADWARRDGALAKKYNLELDRGVTSGNRVDRIRLNGLKEEQSFNQNIRKDIKEYYKHKKCVMLGVNGNSFNVEMQLDHKDGRKNNLELSESENQRKEDFQPLCRAANTIKRQICKECKQTNRRWDAKNIKGNPYSFYCGDEIYTSEIGCEGCYQYDPVKYRKVCVQKISQEVSEDIMKRLYGEEE